MMEHNKWAANRAEVREEPPPAMTSERLTERLQRRDATRTSHLSWRERGDATFCQTVNFPPLQVTNMSRSNDVKGAGPTPAATTHEVGRFPGQAVHPQAHSRRTLVCRQPGVDVGHANSRIILSPWKLHEIKITPRDTGSLVLQLPGTGVPWGFSTTSVNPWNHVEAVEQLTIRRNNWYLAPPCG